MYYFVFSAKSVREYSDAFAVGYVVLRDDGTQYEEGLFASNPSDAPAYNGRNTPLDWRMQRDGIPVMPYNCNDPAEVRERCWKVLARWVNFGAAICTESAFPVATNLLAKCCRERQDRQDDAPRPLHEIASLALPATLGREPLAQWDRLPNEKPEGNPLCEARHIARKMADYMGLFSLSDLEE